MEYSAVTQPRPELRSQPGNALLDGGIGQHAGVAERNQHRAFGGLDESGSEREWPELVHESCRQDGKKWSENS